MTSIPAPDLSNLKFSRARAEEFGHLRRANTVLLLVLVLVVAALSAGAWQVGRPSLTSSLFTSASTM